MGLLEAEEAVNTARLPQGTFGQQSWVMIPADSGVHQQSADLRVQTSCHAR